MLRHLLVAMRQATILTQASGRSYSLIALHRCHARMNASWTASCASEVAGQHVDEAQQALAGAPVERVEVGGVRHR